MKLFLSGIIAFFLFGFTSLAQAENKEWTYKDWSVRFEREKIFYETHGSTVWGHEFGFFKPSGLCSDDTIWVTFSFDNDKVLNFIGKDVSFRITVDGTPFKVSLNMLTAERFTEMTKVMFFTNSYAGVDLISILNKGKKLTLEIIGPESLVKYLDIKSDEFSLNGFIASRAKAKEMCDVITLK